MKKFFRGIISLLILVLSLAFSACSEDELTQEGGSQTIEQVSPCTDPEEDPTGSGSGCPSDSTKVGG